MKKLLFILLVLLFTVTSWAADQNIYLDNAGAGDGSIGNPYGAFSEINWTTGGVNSIYDWVDGGDDVYINLKRGVTWRETLTVGTDGASGHPITIQAYDSGSAPIVSAADINTSWSLQSQETGYAVYRGGPGGGDAEYLCALDDGATDRNPYHKNTATTWANYVIDRQFCGEAGTSYYYIRTDGTAQDPGSVEIGTREHALAIESRSYLTFEGIDFQGPNGVPTGGSSGTKYYGIIDATVAATNITIGSTPVTNPHNVSVRYGTIGIRLAGSGLSNITIQNTLIEKCWGGVYNYHGSYTSDSNTLFQDCTIRNIAEVYLEGQGDKGSFANFLVRGITIRRCYIHDQGSADLYCPDDILDYALTFAGAMDIEVSHCLIKSVAKGAISYGMGSTDTASNILIMYNVIDDFAKYPVAPATNTHSGIAIKNYNGCTVNNLRLYGNTITGANAPGGGSTNAGIYINGANQTNDEWHIDNNITNNLDNMNYELIVEWGTITNRTINNNCFYQAGDAVSIAGTPETTLELNNRAYADSNIDTTPDLQADYHLGASSTCDGAGDTLDAAYDDGLDEDTTWSSLSVLTAPQNTPWDIGAFIYGTETAGWTGKIGGVTNPAKVMGIDKSNIHKIMGIEGGP